eukprot:765049-Hanusia_phi.AAC.3
MQILDKQTGDSILHFAAQSDRRAMAEMLIEEFAADPVAKNKQGQSPLDVAFRGSEVWTLLSTFSDPLASQSINNSIEGEFDSSAELNPEQLSLSSSTSQSPSSLSSPAPSSPSQSSKRRGDGSRSGSKLHSDASRASSRKSKKVKVNRQEARTVNIMRIPQDGAKGGGSVGLGIGVVVDPLVPCVRVERVQEGGAAWKSGERSKLEQAKHLYSPLAGEISVGDEILAVDGTKLKHLEASHIAELLLGRPGSVASLLVSSREASSKGLTPIPEEEEALSYANYPLAAILEVDEGSEDFIPKNELHRASLKAQATQDISLALNASPMRIYAVDVKSSSSHRSGSTAIFCLIVLPPRDSADLRSAEDLVKELNVRASRGDDSLHSFITLRHARAASIIGPVKERNGSLIVSPPVSPGPSPQQSSSGGARRSDEGSDRTVEKKMNVLDELEMDLESVRREAQLVQQQSQALFARDVTARSPQRPLIPDAELPHLGSRSLQSPEPKTAASYASTRISSPRLRSPPPEKKELSPRQTLLPSLLDGGGEGRRALGEPLGDVGMTCQVCFDLDGEIQVEVKDLKQGRPAMESGMIQRLDRLVMIDGRKVNQMGGLNKVEEGLRGPVGSSVELTFVRGQNRITKFTVYLIRTAEAEGNENMNVSQSPPRSSAARRDPRVPTLRLNAAVQLDHLSPARSRESPRTEFSYEELRSIYYKAKADAQSHDRSLEGSRRKVRARTRMARHAGGSAQDITFSNLISTVIKSDGQSVTTHSPISQGTFSPRIETPHRQAQPDRSFESWDAKIISSSPLRQSFPLSVAQVFQEFTQNAASPRYQAPAIEQPSSRYQAPAIEQPSPRYQAPAIEQP